MEPRLTDLRKALGCVAVLAALSGCSSATLQSASDFRDENRLNLSRLTSGMPRAEVLDIMGSASLTRPLGSEGGGVARTETDTLGVAQVQIVPGARGPALYNPMRSATYRAGDSVWEVLFYYVRLVEDDGVVADDELEPIVLRNGFLVGTGWRFYEETARAEGMSLDLVPPEGP
jgi:hypothetical protein